MGGKTFFALISFETRTFDDKIEFNQYFQRITMSRGGLLGSIARFDKASMKHTANLTNKRDPKTLAMLAAEAVAFYIEKIKLNLNHDQLWVVFKVLSRGNKMEDRILKRMVAESESRFYDIEEYKLLFNQKVTREGLKCILQLFPNLKRIDISGCTFSEDVEIYRDLFSLLVSNKGWWFGNRDPRDLTNVCDEFNWEAVWLRKGELDFVHKKDS